MKRTIHLFLLLTGVASFAAQEPGSKDQKPAPKPASLRWNNGETITGEILEASASDLTWKSPLFEEPLQLNWSALRRIDQARPSVPFTDTFSVALRNGDVIHGDLVSLTESVINLHSSRHGDVAVKRSEVLSLRRLRGGNLVYSGPSGDVGWVQGGADRQNGGSRSPKAIKVPTLLTGAGGALSMPYWRGKASLVAPLPEKASVEFLVSSSARPDFGLSLDNGKQPLRVETWDDQLVLVSGNAFKFIRKIADDERQVGLRVCLNRTSRTCSVFSLSGDALIDWQVPVESKGSTITLESGRDLTLEMLRIRPWDGQPPAKCDLTKPRVETADGKVLDGRVTEGSTDSVNLTEPGKETETVIPLDQVDAIVFSVDAPKPVEQPAMLSFADGTRVGGRPQSAKEGEVTLETSFTETPLNSKLENLRQWLIRFPRPEGAEPEPSLSKLDSIISQQTTLHGKLSGVGDGSPRWLPVGGLKATKPSKDIANEIVRVLPPAAEPVADTALVYTRAGDVLPGRVSSLDTKQVSLESTIIENTSLPVEDLDAIQFSPNARKDIHGFKDASWRVLKGGDSKVRRDGERLTMEPESSIGNSAAMLSSEINFKFCSTNFSAVRLRLFCSGTDGSKSVNLVLLRNGDQLSIGLETDEGQFDGDRQTPVSNDPVQIRIAIQSKGLGLYINGGLVDTFPIPAERRLGGGLIIEPASMWGNSVSPIELSDFRTKAEPGLTWVPTVSAEIKQQVLTVPRFRKENPPRHALIAANGDVLRGEIEAATATHFGFRSGLETLRVPRDRVKAAIWLKKPDANTPPPEPRSPTLAKLEQRFGVQFGGAIQLSFLIQYLDREAGGLKIKLPNEFAQQSYDIQTSGRTIAEVLGMIGEVCGLTYRIDKDGSVVFERPKQLASGLVQKVYWLKSAALPPDPPVQKLLAGKGVSFPEGASANWRPLARELTVINTAENQDKLAQLLDAEFGGSTGSPTHWLILSNGGRIGLTVDKFEDEWISGRHPVYGACKVPMKDVYTIRTSPPESSAAMKALADWHLVYAPEPVLPESGGESAPLLGKDAKPFKLAMLAGGDFELAKEKGKVVVLDFWATWCGPCVKSLPGLIEAMAPFPKDRVKFIGVNQGEAPDHVKDFLGTRGWKLEVALDASQSAAQLYGVDGIPHTVVIAPDGKIAMVKSGYSPEGETEIANAVKQLLDGGSRGASSEPAPVK